MECLLSTRPTLSSILIKKESNLDKLLFLCVRILTKQPHHYQNPSMGTLPLSLLWISGINMSNYNYMRNINLPLLLCLLKTNSFKTLPEWNNLCRLYNKWPFCLPLRPHKKRDYHFSAAVSMHRTVTRTLCVKDLKKKKKVFD